MPSLFIDKWKQRFKMLCYLPFSNRSLKYFPPDFTLRDPVAALAKEQRAKGKGCYLILFHLEDFPQLFLTYPYSSIQELQQQINHMMLDMLPRFFKHQDIIGIKRFGQEDIGLFVKQQPGVSYDQLQQKGQGMCSELQARLRAGFAKQEGLLTCSAGCYMMGPDIENIEAAIQFAYRYALSIAMKKLPVHFSQSRQQLIDIIQTENIAVLAQPIMNLTSGDIFGWEILTRGPQNTPFHSPAELFDYAYQADVLSKMEFLVMKKAFEEMAKRSIKEQVFINVTPVTLSHPLLLRHLMKLLDAYPTVAPSQIVLEITERHAIKDFRFMGALMSKYRSIGFRFAVDDAGAGYSSLQSITELIPDIIKIDKSVIQNIDQMTVKQSLLRSLVHFAENINCQVIAEGVERAEEAEMLYDLKVQMGQGFYFAKPEPLEADQDRIQRCDLLKAKVKRSRQASMMPA
ncbi:EAL domain-containing protein [Paenibacillus sp. OAS669]|uniref:EAL domain-containing protein n=1 Tax=Paenibacillus sp. OAS669 TaxID=2663821 RepID=UPI00178A0384|nr:EAL domain-containing protein [Paenibacillus sp. OAS669]MBE1441527.1 EAL domain-containing protein (putative c-di-GMP-specific phosphodiesterase class I) [Paenibacillus sp. OAS669]